MANKKALVLSDLTIQKLKQPDSKKWIRDGGGLALCLTPAKSGKWRHWYFIYISPETGKKCYKPLGSYPDVKLSAARETVDIILRPKVATGIDPMAEERRNTQLQVKADKEESEVKTVRELASEYMEKYAKKNKRESSWTEDQRLLDKNVLPFWGDQKARDIRRCDVVDLLESYADRPALTHNVFKLVRKMFNFAISRGITETTPCPGVNIDDITTLTSRKRVLKEPAKNNGVDEILTFWTELEKASMSDEVKRCLKLILVTGQRPGEVIGIHSDEITVEEWEGKKGTWWTIPVSRRKVKEKSKNPPEPHYVYLNNMALELLGDFKGYAFLSPKCQPPKEGRKSRRNDPDAVIVPTHIEENALANAVRKNLKDYKHRRPISGDTVKMVKVKESRKMDIEHFTPHDLRRTFSTRIAGEGMDISNEVNDAILGHTVKGVLSIYNHQKYALKKIMAAEAWERKLTSIITGTPAGNACGGN